MKKNVLLALSVIFSSSFVAQQINWAISASKAGAYMSLITDNSSNVYLYSYSKYWNGPNESEGTHITKYDPNGTKLLDLHWKGKIYLSKMIYDGKGSFYFTGHFSETINSQGFNLVSNGKSDCFFGKMDEQGQIAWTVGFGGAKEDLGNSLSFNHDGSAIVLTGSVDSTVYLHGYPIITTTKAIFLISFDQNAQLIQYKTYSYLPDQYGTNSGLEIAANSNGYFLLADRMGQHWSNEPLPVGTEMEGRYLFSIDNSFNIKWSKYIISSSCYYGYSCKNMAVCNDDAYVPRFCSGKYGGSGHFDRLSGADGNTSWFLENNDGQYYDSYAYEGRVFFVGNEEVNGCPCEANDPGSAKVKVVDKNNMQEVLFTKYGFQFHNITHAKNGSIYVFGHTRGEDPSLGGFPLADGYFLFSMKDPTTGIQQIMPSGEILTLYPNPSQGDVTIESQYIMNEVTVFDLSGATINQLNPNAKTCSLQGLPGGCYALRIKSGDKYTTTKIVVTK